MVLQESKGKLAGLWAKAEVQQMEREGSALYSAATTSVSDRVQSGSFEAILPHICADSQC